MKLFLTLWIATVLIQEVFTSTLVRIPRHDLTKPTSSVHTEYEATYQQKGKHGNGSFSTVSGKQQVVHDSCGDNWNTFAEKCATLIKDLVASLANAVSSKPGDATNLQLRIKNTFKHFDSSDNCTCHNHKANIFPGLASLFDNITINTVQPTANGESVVNNEAYECINSPCKNDSEKNKISPTYKDSIKGDQIPVKTCDSNFCDENNDDHEKPYITNQSTVEEKTNHPNLASANAEGVNPEFFDSSKELLTNNSRRQTKHPEVIASEHPHTSDSKGKQLFPSSTSSNGILLPGVEKPAAQAKAGGSPTKIVSPQSQSKNNAVKSAGSAPQQNFLQSAFPDRNINLAKSDISLKPAPSVPSSASQISSLQEGKPIPSSTPNNAVSGSGSNHISSIKSDALTPAADNNIALNDEENNDEPNQTSIAASIPFKTDPLNKLESELITASKGNVGSPTAKNSNPNQSSVVKLIVPSTNAVNGASDISEDFSKSNDESNPTPVAAPIMSKAQTVAAAPAKTQVSPADKEDSTTVGSGSNQMPYDQVVTPVASVGAPFNRVAGEPSAIPNNNDELKKENNNGSKLTSGIAPTMYSTQPVQPQNPISYSEGNGVGLSQTPTITPVITTEQPLNIPIARSKILSGDIAEKDVTSNQTPMVTPIVSSADLAEPQVALDNHEDWPEENNGESNQTPMVLPEISMAKPVSSAQPRIPLDNSGGKKAVTNEAPVVTPILSTADPIRTNLTESQVQVPNDEDRFEENNGELNQTPMVLSPEYIEKPLNMAEHQPRDSSLNGEGNGAESDQIPIITSVAPTAHLDSGAQSKAQIASNNNEDFSEDSKDESKQIPVFTPSVTTVQPVSEAKAKPQITSNTGEGYLEGNNGESNQTPVISSADTAEKPVDEAVAVPQISLANNGGEIDKLNQTPVVTSVASASEPVNEAARESQTAPDNDGKLSEESKDESNQTPEVTSSASPVNGAVVQPQISLSGSGGEDFGSNQTPLITPVESKEDLVRTGEGEPQSLPNSKGEDDTEGNNSETNQKEVVGPETSQFVLDKKMNSASIPNSELRIGIPVVNSTQESNLSNDFGRPEELGQSPPLVSTKSEGPAFPEDPVNVIPDLVVKQPDGKHLAQKSPSSVAPVINSNSNLLDSKEPLSNASTIYSSPINEPLPLAPSPVPPSSAAISKKGPKPETNIDQKKDIFIVTPVPVYPEKIDPVIFKTDDKLNSAIKGIENHEKPNESEQAGDPSKPEQIADLNVKPPKGAKGSLNTIIKDNESRGNQPLVVPVPKGTTPTHSAPETFIPEKEMPQSKLVQTEDYQPKLLLTTPIPALPEPDSVKTSEANGNFVQQHPLFSNLQNKKLGGTQPERIIDEPLKTDGELSSSNSQTSESFSSSTVVPPMHSKSSSGDVSSAKSQPKPGVIPQPETSEIPVSESAENSDPTKATTFQTTSTDPTPPQKIIPSLTKSVPGSQSASTPQDSFETAHDVPTNSPQSHGFNGNDDDDDEDCCSCESCTEEEISNPKQYKEMACKDLEDAKKELKAIFDKIKKKLKCGRKAPQKIVTS